MSLAVKLRRTTAEAAAVGDGRISLRRSATVHWSRTLEPRSAREPRVDTSNGAALSTCVVQRRRWARVIALGEGPSRLFVGGRSILYDIRRRRECHARSCTSHDRRITSFSGQPTEQME